MKKNSLVAVFSFFALFYASYSTAYDCFDICVLNNKDYYTFEIGALVLKPTLSNSDFVGVQHTSDDNINLDFVNAHADYTLGGHFAIGIGIVRSGTEIMLEANHVGISETTSLSAQDAGTLIRTLQNPQQVFFAVVGTVINDALVFNSIFDNLQVSTAAVRNNLTYDDITLNALRNIKICNNRGLIQLSAGIRYLYLDRKFNVVYATSASDVPPAQGVPVPPDLNVAVVNNLTISEFIDQRSEFKGAGPEFGINAKYCLGHGFYFTGHFATGVAVGRISDFFEDNIFRLTTPRITVISGTVFTVLSTINLPRPPNDFVYTKETTRFVPNIEGNLGIMFAMCPFCKQRDTVLSLELGYATKHFYQAIDTMGGVAATDPEFRITHTLDIGYSGPYLNLRLQI